MNIKQKIIGYGQQSFMGMTRFTGASITALTLFLVVFFRVLYTVLIDPTTDTFSDTIIRLIITLTTTILFAVLWRIIGERCGKTGMLYEAVNLPVFGVLWLLWQNMPMTTYYIMYVGGTWFTLFCFVIYALWTKKSKGLFSYLFTIFWAVVGQTVLVSVLGALCILAIDVLLLRVSFDWWSVWIAFCYVFSIQLFLSYLPRVGEELSSPSLSFLLERIFLPAYSVMLVILYLYMGKMAITMTMPVGRMNWYASFAVALYGLFYFCLNEEKNTKVIRFLRYGGIALLPVMVVQAWGIYIRFDAYGLTTARYVSMVCNVFGLVVIAFSVCRYSGKNLFLLAGILGIMLTLLPTNMIDIPARNQWNRLHELIVEKNMVKDGKLIIPDGLSLEEKEKIRSVYQYLYRHPGRWRYPLIESMENDKTLYQFLHIYRDDHFIHLSYEWKYRSVAGYDKMYDFSVQNEDITDDGTITLDTPDGKKTIPIAPYIEKMRKIAPMGFNGTAEEMTYDVNEYRRIYFDDVYFPREGNFRKGYFNGHLLEK